MTLNRIASFSIFAGLGLVWVAACGSDSNGLFGSTGDTGSSGAAGSSTSGGSGTGGSQSTAATGGATGGTAGSSGETVGAGGATSGTAGAATTGGAGTSGGGSAGSGGAPGTGGAGGKSTGGAGGTTGGAGGTAGAGMGGHDAGVAGAGGSADAGSDVCMALEAAYGPALTEAKVCNPKAPAQCVDLANTSLSCPGCTTHVQDPSKLQALNAKWLAAGCHRGICPAIACIAPGVGACSESGGSGGRCVDSRGLPPQSQ